MGSKTGQLEFKTLQTSQILARLGELERESRVSSWRVQKLIGFSGLNSSEQFDMACRPLILLVGVDSFPK